MNFGLRHFWNDVMQIYYPQASISTNFPFNFLKKVVRDQRWPTASMFFVYISRSFGKFTATLRHILQIYITYWIHISLKSSVKCVPKYITFWLGIWIKLVRIKFQLLYSLFSVVSNHLCFSFSLLISLTNSSCCSSVLHFSFFLSFPPSFKTNIFVFLGYILWYSSCRMFLFDLYLIVIYYYAGTCATSPGNTGNDFVSPRTTDKGLFPSLLWCTIYE